MLSTLVKLLNWCYRQVKLELTASGRPSETKDWTVSFGLRTQSGRSCRMRPHGGPDDLCCLANACLARPAPVFVSSLFSGYYGWSLGLCLSVCPDYHTPSALEGFQVSFNLLAVPVSLPCTRQKKKRLIRNLRMKSSDFLMEVCVANGTCFNWLSKGPLRA